jgi:hypothetical protein
MFKSRPILVAGVIGDGSAGVVGVVAAAATFKN